MEGLPLEQQHFEIIQSIGREVVFAGVSAILEGAISGRLMMATICAAQGIMDYLIDFWVVALR